MNLVEDVQVQCPYCGEMFAISVDTSQGSYVTTEDCSVCCRPIAFDIACEPGEVISVGVGLG
ncbi:MAG TPA: CPXCG motif-containing cysteine-rich protein [Chthoniobacteraceae bacterium]|nr:CPXCG motif-containing cysteine-rich protein [Chthoniobacteraceae bacterium]